MNKSFFGTVPYIPGHPTEKPELFSRYLPPIRDGVVSTWLRMNTPPGAWVLDPFGASPRLALEAAQAGYRVLVAANNPIIRFILEIVADPPTEDALKASLAELAASYIGNERVEPHIRALYNTICACCGQEISADAFLWEHGIPTPYARIYTCPFCGDTGEHPCTSYDAEHIAKLSGSGLHKARALERVVAFNDQDREHVEQALSVYSPRAIYALITLINKMEGLNTTSEGHKQLAALLLYTFDQANSMWKPQAQPERRRQLAIPRHYRENNVWNAMEEGIGKWKAGQPSGTPSVPLAIWPKLPPPGAGICIFEGRLANLIDSIIDMDIASVCTALPRPNQAYWTLSALWAGWLWGREAVGTFKSVLHRQRYEWAWHASALSSVFKQLSHSLKPSTAVFGLIGEAEPGFLGSALVAAAVGGCRLESMALRPEEKQAQMIWKTDKNFSPSQTGAGLTQIASDATSRYLELNAEPASYLITISAALVGEVQHWYTARESLDGQQASLTAEPPAINPPAPQGEPTPSMIYSGAYNSAREALSYRQGFLRYTLQVDTDIEASAKSEAVQSALFSMDTEKIIETDEEPKAGEVSTSDDELMAEKQRPTRSAEVSESSFLWLRETGEVNRISSSDNYETFVLDYLVAHPGCTAADVDQAVCAEFPGLFTPDVDIIRLCLQSYGQPITPGDQRWSIRPEDAPAERLSDTARIHHILHEIGIRLQFTITDRSSATSKPYTCWSDDLSGKEYWFFTCTSAAIGEIVLHGEQPPGKGFVVIPASRTNLLVYKLRRDPRLNKAFNPSQGAWQFLKFRHLRSLHDSAMIDRDNWEQMLDLDPLTFTTPQLWLM